MRLVNLRLILLLISICFIENASADSVYFPGQCGVTTNFNLPSRKREVIEAQLKIKFEKETPLPIIDLHIPQVSSNKVSLTFPELKILRDDGSKIFPEAYHDSLVIFANESIDFYQIEPGVYRSPSLGITGTQQFLSLYLSQFGFYVESSDQKIKAYAKLRKSDLNVRSMLKFCFPKRSETYLDGLRRKDEVGKSWMNVYGLFDIPNISKEVLAYRPSLSEGSEEAIEKTHSTSRKLIKLIYDKQNILKGIFDLQASEEFLSVISEKALQTNRLWSSVEKLNEIYGSGHKAKALDIKIDRLNQEITELFNTKEEAKQNLSPVAQQYLKETQQLMTYIRELRENSERLAIVDTELKSTAADIKFLSGELQEDIKFLQTESFELEAPTPFIPYDLDQIRQERAEALNYSEAKNYLDKKIFFNNRILEEMQQINTTQDDVIEFFNSLSHRRTELSMKQLELDQVMEEKIKVKTHWKGLSPNEIQSQLYVLWTQVDAEVSTADLNDIVNSNLLESSNSYDNALENLPSSVLKTVLCRSRSRTAPFTPPCLTPLQIRNEAAYIDFFDRLDTQDYSLIVNSTFSPQSPFSESFNSDAIIEQMSLESQDSRIFSIENTWKEIIFYEWMNKHLHGITSEKPLNGKYFLAILNKEQQQLSNLEDSESQLITEIVAQSVSYESYLEDYRNREQEYFDHFQKVRLRVLNLISMDDLEIDSSGIECLIFNSNFVSCYDDINQELTENIAGRERNIQKMAKSAIILSTVSAHKMQELLVQKQVLEEERTPLIRQIDLLTSSRDSLQNSKGFKEITELKEELEETLNSIIAELQMTQSQLKQAKKDQENTVSEGRFSANQIDILYSELQEIKTQLNQHCQQEVKLMDDISKVNSKIETIVDGVVLDSKRSISKYCQLWL